MWLFVLRLANVWVARTLEDIETGWSLLLVEYRFHLRRCAPHHMT